MQEVNLDGYIDDKCIQYIGKAILKENGFYHCLANINGCLCVVEVKLTFTNEKIK